MKTNVLTKMALFSAVFSFCCPLIAQSLDPQEEWSSVEKKCESALLSQNYVVHFPEVSYLILDFNEVPASPIEIYLKENIVYSGLGRHLEIPLKKDESYKVKSRNNCGETFSYLSVNTKVNFSRSEVKVTNKLYELLRDKLVAKNEEPLWTYLEASKLLNFPEKLFFIQEYYLNGNMGNLGSSFFEGWFGGELEDFQGVLDWNYLGEKIEDYVFKIPSRNCHCATIVPRLAPDHKIANIKTTQPFKYSMVPNNASLSTKTYGRGNYFYWRDSVVGAAKSQRVKQRMKGSHTKREEYTTLQKGSMPSNQTVMSFTFYCEDVNGVRDDCMCKDRKVIVYANYTSNVKAEAKKVKCTFCGSGYAAFAQVEDWATLSKGSLKTPIGVLDAGRVLASDNNYVSHNGQYKFKILDLAEGIFQSYQVYKSSGNLDTTSISKIRKDLEALLKQPMKTGGGSGVSVGTSFLLDEKGVAVEVLPNDPTNIIVHSFSNHQLSGHTKWVSETWLQSSVALAGYMNYEQSSECCTNDNYKWIVGGGFQSNVRQQLRGVNYFLASSGISPKYPRLLVNKYTDEDENGHHVVNNCSPFLLSSKPFTAIKEGASYVVTSVQTGEVIVRGRLHSPMDSSQFNFLLEQKLIEPGLYVAEIKNENQIVKYKIQKL